jgi:hypothetical protein
MNNQPGYGHIQRGDVTGWARGRVNPVRPLCDGKLPKPVKVKGRLKRKTIVSAVEYPHNHTSIVGPVDTNPKPVDICEQIDRTHMITALCNARLTGRDEFLEPFTHNLWDSTVECIATA